MVEIIKNIGGNSLRGDVRLPGDKSISHRAAMLLSISEGSARISNYATGEDCLSTLNALRSLGVEISGTGDEVEIEGSGIAGYKRPLGPIDCGNSGTTMRLLSGLLSVEKFETVLVGDESLSARPMRRIAVPLSEFGAEIGLQDGRPPIEIRPARGESELRFKLEVPSAQVKSCILLAGLNGGLKVTAAASAHSENRSASRDHTERMLEFLGVSIETKYRPEDDGWVEEISVSGDGAPIARDIDVPGDFSSAAFFLVAAAIVSGSEIRMPNTGLNPTRTALLEVLEQCGSRIRVENQQTVSGEPRGDLYAGSLDPARLPTASVVLGGSRIPNLIDEIPVLSILGTVLPHGLVVRGASELRVKESDRIAAVVNNLRQMGASVEEFEDGFAVSRSSLKGAEIDPKNDHRIAMAFAIAGLIAEGETRILNPSTADVSFPGFFKILDTLSMR